MGWRPANRFRRGSSSKRWRRTPHSSPVSHMCPAERRKKATICLRLQAGDSFRVADSPEVSSAVPTAAVPDLFADLTADRSVGQGAAGVEVGGGWKLGPRKLGWRMGWLGQRLERRLEQRLRYRLGQLGWRLRWLVLSVL